MRESPKNFSLKNKILTACRRRLSTNHRYSVIYDNGHLYKHQVSLGYKGGIKLLISSYASSGERERTTQKGINIHSKWELVAIAYFSIPPRQAWGLQMNRRSVGHRWANGKRHKPSNQLHSTKVVSSPDPTLSRGETIWWTKLNFLGSTRFCDNVT